ncbi:phage tail protein [Citrobacter portucalensis]|uniref:phage tail fiber protein n=1 Tax=Citrobacter portucalensis TaxID=1639133 RepID=UPI00339C87A3
MSAGTLTLTNNSAAVSGSGTSFTTELAAGDFTVVTVGGIPYTLPVKTVNSNTSLTLVSNFTGPTQSGAAWSAVPRVAMNMVTAALVAQSAEALRGLNYDKQNWQQVFSGTGTITVRLPDGTNFTGPSWKYLADNMATKKNGAVPVDEGGTGATTADKARTNLGLSTYLQTDTQTIIRSPNGASSLYVYNNLWGVTQNGVSGWILPQGMTVDSNGFLKKASPIVKLKGDGAAEFNEEAIGATVERLSTGVYKISGVLGFNSDPAWGGISGGYVVPQNGNGLPLLWLDYDVAEDGDLIIRTYHREHVNIPEYAQNHIEGLKDGDPVDIPAGRWVDLRVEMPADSIWNRRQEEVRGEMEKA